MVRKKEESNERTASLKMGRRAATERASQIRFGACRETQPWNSGEAGAGKAASRIAGFKFGNWENVPENRVAVPDPNLIQSELELLFEQRETQPISIAKTLGQHQDLARTP